MSYNDRYRQEVIYFICIVFILTGGPGSNEAPLVRGLAAVA